MFRLKSLLFAITVVVSVLSVADGNRAMGQVWCPSCGTFHQTAAPNNYAGVEDGLAMLNEQRRRAGLFPFQRAMDLEAVASARVVKVATWRGGRFAGHPPGSFAPARGEGVGYVGSSNPRTFSACFTSTTRYRYASAKVYRTGGRSFFTLLVR